MKDMKVEYLVVDDGGQYPDDARTLPGQNRGAVCEYDYESLARDAADHDFSYHCGYERYPRDGDDCAFEIFVDGESIGVFDVSVCAEPRFSATRRRVTP